jgi:hypothetical protein
LSAPAKEATSARRRIRGDYALAYMKSGDAFADGGYVACQFVAKQCRRHNHLGVIATPEHFDVRAARERCPDANQDFARAHGRNRHRFQAHIFLAVEDCRSHRRAHVS